MDKEHAKFILRSFRADGADADNPDFSKALEMATEDRELGAWLAAERANDALFTEALCSIDIPSGLRDEILSVMQHDATIVEDNHLDALFGGAISSIAVPDGLRDQILSSMEVEKVSQTQNATEENKLVNFPKWTMLAAIAAVFIVAATLLLTPFDGNRIDMHTVQIESGSLLNENISMDISQVSLEGVNQWLISEGLPRAETVPQGLIKSTPRGVKRIVFDNGTSASMIFFEKKDVGDIYMMVLQADKVEDADALSAMEKIDVKRCKKCPMTSFTITSWKDQNKVYMLLSKAPKEKLYQVF